MQSTYIGTLLAGMSAEGTTRSAVADGSITVRGKVKKQPGVTTLSSDTEHTNGSIGQIVNKE